MSRKSKLIWRGVLLGAAGGFIGSWMMNQSQTLMSKAMKADPKPEEAQEPATVRAAEKIARATLELSLRPAQKKAAEPIVHYGFGTLVGALYGGLAAAVPIVTLGAGTLYGAAVWLLADEIAVPALGLSKSPAQYPLPAHLEALGAHLVYGLTTEGVRSAGSKLVAA